MMRTPLRFVSEEDSHCYRKGVRTLALVYVGILVLGIVVTSLRVEWRKHEVTAKAMAGPATTADLGRERARMRSVVVASAESSSSPGSSGTASAARCTIRNSPWSNGIARMASTSC